jgi:RimJ/RimL family protein N-acetyltransferase
MRAAPVLLTPRLTLRGWRPDDRAPFAALNADAEVMRYFPGTIARPESDALADRIEAHFARHGFGAWAVEIVGVAPFAGYVGLSVPAFQAAFTPCVEIEWCLARAWWGQGYATEAARAAAHYGLETLRLPEVLSFTVPGNLASRRVMEKVGMTHDPSEDFDHPGLPAGHALRRHLLYRLRA